MHRRERCICLDNCGRNGERTRDRLQSCFSWHDQVVILRCTPCGWCIAWDSLTPVAGWHTQSNYPACQMKEGVGHSLTVRGTAHCSIYSGAPPFPKVEASIVGLVQACKAAAKMDQATEDVIVSMSRASCMILRTCDRMDHKLHR